MTHDERHEDEPGGDAPDRRRRRRERRRARRKSKGSEADRPRETVRSPRDEDPADGAGSGGELKAHDSPLPRASAAPPRVPGSDEFSPQDAALLAAAAERMRAWREGRSPSAVEELRDHARARLRALVGDLTQAGGDVGPALDAEALFVPVDRDVPWLEMAPVALSPHGARAEASPSPGTHPVLERTVGGVRVEVLVQPRRAPPADAGGPSGDDDPELDVTGTVLRVDGEPSPGLSLALVADHVVVARAVTDELGQFSFEGRRAARLGLRIGSGSTAPLLQLWQAD